MLRKMFNKFRRTRGLVVFGAMLIGIAACGGDDAADTAPVDSGNSGDGAQSAIALLVRINSPDGTVFFTGALPEVPTGEFNVDEFVELGPGAFNMTVFDGAIFTPNTENQTWTRWEVDDDLKLSQAGVMSVANLGVASAVAAFVSPTVGYLIDVTEGLAVKFDPSAMEIIESIDINLPPTTVPGFAFETHPWGDSMVLIPIWAVDSGTLTFHEQGMVGFFDTETDEITYVSDDRVATSRGAFVHENGDAYLMPSPAAIHAAHYSDQADADTPTLNGMVRIKAGETEFDPDFFQPLDEITGDSAVWNSTYLGGDRILQLTFAQPRSEWPDNPDDWWGIERTKNIIDMGDWSSARLSSPLEDDFQTAWFNIGEVDDVQYIGLSPGGAEGVGGLARFSGSDFELVATFPGGGAFNGIWKLR